MTGDERSDEPLEGWVREVRPDPALEARVVSALRARGLLHRRTAVVPWAAAAALLGALAGWWAGSPPPAAPAAVAGEPLYLLLLWPSPPDAANDEAALVLEYAAWARDLRRRGRLVSAEKLADAGRRVDPAPGGGVSVEPEASPPSPSGFFLVRAGSLEEAVALAEECPHLRHGGGVSVRPVDPT